MFLAILQAPRDASAVQRAAGIVGLSPADVSRSLAGTLPRILLRATMEGERVSLALETAGFRTLLGETSSIQTDAARLVARELSWSPDGLVAVDGRGARQECPVVAMAAFIRGFRFVTATETVVSTKRAFAPGKALLTGGLALTKKVETRETRAVAEKEAFVLILRNDGGSDIALYERRLDYRCLGSALAPSTCLNFNLLFARLRALAPEAPLDQRILQPGFLNGLPPMGVEAADLAIHLVREATQRDC